MCCDFYFKNYKKNNNNIPNIVGEIKFAISHQSQNVWNECKKDIEKCMEWLKPDTTPHLVERFNIIKFDYALAILIDLTGGETYSNLWNSEMKKNGDGIFKREDYCSPHSAELKERLADNIIMSAFIGIDNA